MPNPLHQRLLTACLALVACFGAAACGPVNAEALAAFAARGWVYDADPGNGSTFTARGTVRGRTFTIEGRFGGGKSGGARTAVNVATDTGPSVVLVTHAVPDFIRLDGQLAGLLLPNMTMPPRWDGAPAALRGTWDVYASPADGERWVTQALIDRLLTLPEMARPPYLLLANGQSQMMAPGVVWTDAQLVSLIETAAAVGPGAPEPTGAPES